MSRTLTTTLIILLLFAVDSAHAAVIASTDFDGRGLTTVNVANDTATNLNWTLSGVSDPGNLTAIDVNSTGSLAGLHNSNALNQNLFGPDLNLDNEGPWSATVTLSALPNTAVTLTDVTFDQQNLSNGGAANPARNVDFTVSVTGSVSGLLDTIVKLNEPGPVASLSFVLTSPIALSPLETYDVTILAANDVGPGNNVGIDNLSINGTVEILPETSSVPEPSTVVLAALGLLGMCWLGWRRRER